MCSVYTYNKGHVLIPDDAITGGGIPIPSVSYKDALYHLCQKIKFLDNWFQFFEVVFRT